MGPVIFKRYDKHGAEIALSALPLGGYVAFHTEKASDDDSELLEGMTQKKKANTCIFTWDGITNNSLDCNESYLG